MSILDEEDILMERAEHNVKVAAYTPEFDKRSWDEFQTEAIEPIVKKLAAHKRVGKFAVGVYVPTEPLFHWGVASSIYSMCRAYRLRCFHINGSRYTFQLFIDLEKRNSRIRILGIINIRIQRIRAQNILNCLGNISEKFLFSFSFNQHLLWTYRLFSYHLL